MIRLSAKSRYAVSALMHLAIHNDAGPVPLAEVSVCQGISMSYVDQIFARLRREGLVVGMPGPGGGYRLGRPAEEISVGDVIGIMEVGRARRSSQSALDDAIWRGLGHDIERYLSRLTLADFVRRPAIRQALRAQYAGRQWRCDVCGVLANRGSGEARPRAS